LLRLLLRPKRQGAEDCAGAQKPHEIRTFQVTHI